MNLQGRDLKQELTGEDVRLLQSELGQLGYTIPGLWCQARAWHRKCAPMFGLAP